MTTYLPEKSDQITISYTLPKKSVENRYAENYAQSCGLSIPLRVYGKVWQPIDLHANIRDLKITPLAVY